jgi:hypothetical protein
MKNVRNTSLKYVYVLGFALFLGVLIVALEFSNTTHFFKAGDTISISSANAETKGEPQANSSKATPDSSSLSTEDPKAVSAAGSPTTPPLVPSGSFVSNHKASLSSGQAQSSTCTTTPGATCQITFTKDGVTKVLQLQTTDRGGTAYWSWAPQSINLTTGSWKIEAIARLNGQVRTASDALNLEVSP